MPIVDSSSSSSSSSIDDMQTPVYKQLTIILNVLPPVKVCANSRPETNSFLIWCVFEVRVLNYAPRTRNIDIVCRDEWRARGKMAFKITGHNREVSLYNDTAAGTVMYNASFASSNLTSEFNQRNDRFFSVECVLTYQTQGSPSRIEYRQHSIHVLSRNRFRRLPFDRRSMKDQHNTFCSVHADHNATPIMQRAGHGDQLARAIYFHNALMMETRKVDDAMQIGAHVAELEL